MLLHRRRHLRPSQHDAAGGDDDTTGGGRHHNRKTSSTSGLEPRRLRQDHEHEHRRHYQSHGVADNSRRRPTPPTAATATAAVASPRQNRSRQLLLLRCPPATSQQAHTTPQPAQTMPQPAHTTPQPAQTTQHQPSLMFLDNVRASKTCHAFGIVLYPFTQYRYVEPHFPRRAIFSPRRLVKWAEQRPGQPIRLFYQSIDYPSLSKHRVCGSSGGSMATIQIVIYLVAYIVDHNRFYTIPLLLRGNIGDLDQYIRQHIHYSSVYNPYGSGSYTHWPLLHIHFYLAWHFDTTQQPQPHQQHQQQHQSKQQKQTARQKHRRFVICAAAAEEPTSLLL